MRLQPTPLKQEQGLHAQYRKQGNLGGIPASETSFFGPAPWVAPLWRFDWVGAPSSFEQLSSDLRLGDCVCVDPALFLAELCPFLLPELQEVVKRAATL